MVSDNMDTISHRTVTRYLGLKGLTPKEIHADMVVALGENGPSYSMVKKWAAEFKRGRESLEDDPRQRRPVTVTTQDTIAKIHDTIMADRRVTKYDIVTELGISQDRIHAVIHNKLHTSKVSARCVPKLLGPGLKQTRLNMSRKCPVIFRQIPTVFFRNLGRSLPNWKTDKRSALPSGQCSGTHVHNGHGCYPEIWIPACRRPTLFF